MKIKIVFLYLKFYNKYKIDLTLEIVFRLLY